MIDKEGYLKLLDELGSHAELVAVSKRQPAEKINQLYDFGQRIFGENYVQAMLDRLDETDKAGIRWQMIGHLQSNKVKYLAPFVDLIHGIDNFGLLQVINKEALKNHRTIDCLLQIHIATEESKFGLSFDEARSILESEELKALPHIRICGLMGMATFTDDDHLVRQEFRGLRQFFEQMKHDHFQADDHFSLLSMGMTDDYRIALDEGSTMVRIGTLIFGERG